MGSAVAPVSDSGRGCRSGRASVNRPVPLQSADKSRTAVLVAATKERSLQPSCCALCQPGGGWVLLA